MSNKRPADAITDQATSKVKLALASQIKVLVTANTHKDGLALLSGANFAVKVTDSSISTADLETELLSGGYHALCAGNTKLTRAGIDQALPTLHVVSRHGVGYDGIDDVALTDKGIPLMVIGTANSTAVAEHTLMMILAVSRKLIQWDREVKSNNYYVRDLCSLSSCEGKRVLIVGFGRIGTRVAARCIAFGMQVTVCDPNVPANTVVGLGYQYMQGTLNAPLSSTAKVALQEADYISLHMPALPSGLPLLTSSHFENMKEGIFVINTGICH